MPSLTNRLWRFLNNPKLEVGSWYAPLAEEIIKRLPTGAVTLVVDSTKVGFYHRLLSIGVTFKKRTLPLVWSVCLLCWFWSRNWHFAIRQQGKNEICWAGQPWLKINALALEPGQNRVMGWVRLTEKYNHGWYWLLLHWEVGQAEPWHLVSD